MQKKNILILNYEFPPLGGGAGNATYYLLRSLEAFPEYHFHLVTSSVDDKRITEFTKNCTIHFLDIHKGGNLHHQSNKDLLYYSWKSLLYSVRLHRKEKFIGIHAFFGIPCGFIAMLLRIPYIVSLRGSDVPFYNPRFSLLDTLVFSRLSSLIWKRSQMVIANSSMLKALATRTSPDQQIEIIYNGVDTNEFEPSAEKKDTFTIISTARLIYRKGLNYLISGVAEFIEKQPEANIQVLLAGDGNMKVELQQQVELLNMQHIVSFLGRKNHNELTEIYASGDVFVLPSLSEGMSNSLLEAMASGLAIIATDTGGTSELITENIGYLVEKKDSQGIADALSSLYDDRQDLENKKLYSRIAAEQMSWESVAEQYLLYYKRYF